MNIKNIIIRRHQKWGLVCCSAWEDPNKIDGIRVKNMGIKKLCLSFFQQK